MKMPKSLDNLFNNIYFLYFVAFLAVFNVFAYIIMNNFNAIILFILVGYITYLFSKNMAIVLLVALLMTNLFMGSKNNRMGREGLAGNMLDGSGNYLDGSGNRFDGSGNLLSGNRMDGSGNLLRGKTATPATTTTTTTATSNPAPASLKQKTNNRLGYENLNSTPDVSKMDLEKMQHLLSQSQKLMGDLKTAFPGMSNILGGLGQ
jgi:hypothetical protein